MDARDQARWIGAAPTWLANYYGQGSFANPGAGTISGDTGTLANGWYNVTVVITSDFALGGGHLDFQWRNAANTANKFVLPIISANGICLSFSFGPWYFALNERMRLYSSAGFTGIVTGLIIAAQRA
jgi:hypothetical protein